MPISPFLALNSRGVATPQLKRFINASPSFIGATFAHLRFGRSLNVHVSLSGEVSQFAAMSGWMTVS